MHTLLNGAVLCSISSMVVFASSASPITQEQFELHDTRLSAPSCSTHRDPFDVKCTASVTFQGSVVSSRHPHMNAIPLFYDGNASWVLRFAPDAVGVWVWSTPSCPDCPSLSNRTGQVQCIAGKSMGGILGDANGRLIHEDGSDHVLVGYEVDWLWALSIEPDTSTPSLPTFLDYIQPYGFNHLIVSFYANYTSWATALPPRVAPHVAPTLVTPWLGDPSSGASLNLKYFQHFDEVMEQAHARNMTVHVMIYVGNKNVEWPPLLSDADNVYWEYVLARYAAYPNIVIDVMKEAGRAPTTPAYILNRLSLIHKLNFHKRLVTSHSGIQWSNDCPDCNLTLSSLQVHTANHTSGKWYNDMLQRRTTNKQLPVANVEFMYEKGAVRLCNGSAGHDCTVTAKDIDTMRIVMWDLYMATGYGAWYDCDTAWDVISITNPEPPGYNYVKVMTSFWNSIPQLNEMLPCNSIISSDDPAAMGHCLANGKYYVFHLRSRSEFSLHGIGGDLFLMLWLDPATGYTVEDTLTQFDLTPPAGIGTHGDVVLKLTCITCR